MNVWTPINPGHGWLIVNEKLRVMYYRAVCIGHQPDRWSFEEVVEHFYSPPYNVTPHQTYRVKKPHQSPFAPVSLCQYAFMLLQGNSSDITSQPIAQF
jgi:hypothetical protein